MAHKYQWGDGEAFTQQAYEAYARLMIAGSGSTRPMVPWDELPPKVRSAWLRAGGVTALEYAERELR